MSHKFAMLVIFRVLNITGASSQVIGDAVGAETETSFPTVFLWRFTGIESTWALFSVTALDI